jgi:hypothetical protein
MRATQLKIQASSACSRHLGLVEDDVLFGIDAGRDEGGGDLEVSARAGRRAPATR